jgi:hypothetical protein
VSGELTPSDVMSLLADRRNVDDRSALHINMLLTKRCNFACAHCMYWAGPKQSGAYMSAQDLEDITGFARAVVDQTGCDITVNIVGGEPTLNLAEFERCLYHVSALLADFPSGVQWHMTTNGWWLRSPRTFGRFFSALMAARLLGDITVRISESPYHQPFRGREAPLLRALADGLEVFDYEAREVWGRSKRPEQGQDEPDDEFWERADDFYERTLLPASAGLYWLQDLMRDNRFFVDVQESHHTVSVGRAVDNHIDSNKSGSCSWNGDEEEIMFTFEPGGKLYDPCCNGGHVPLGHAREGLALYLRRAAFMKAMLYRAKMERYSGSEKCLNCPAFGSNWLRDNRKQADALIESKLCTPAPPLIK